jgi:hypothetical protein
MHTRPRRAPFCPSHMPDKDNGTAFSPGHFFVDCYGVLCGISIGSTIYAIQPAADRQLTVPEPGGTKGCLNVFPDKKRDEGLL